MFPTPTPDDITAALDLVAHPADYPHHPAVTQTAWATLKAARGEPVHFDRIGEPQHRIDRAEPPLTSLLGAACARVAPIVRARAQALTQRPGGDSTPGVA